LNVDQTSCPRDQQPHRKISKPLHISAKSGPYSVVTTAAKRSHEKMEIDMTITADALDAEVARQEKHLAQLPENFDFPLFNSKHAIESQRRSGYRNTSAAAREIVDKGIEAKASRIDVFFDQAKRPKGKKDGEAVTAVAFLDDGSGMSPKMVRYALSWGAGA
jgi:hypothetical protein